MSEALTEAIESDIVRWLRQRLGALSLPTQSDDEWCFTVLDVHNYSILEVVITAVPPDRVLALARPTRYTVLAAPSRNQEFELADPRLYEQILQHVLRALHS